jgi:hypothetical protein
MTVILVKVERAERGNYVGVGLDSKLNSRLAISGSCFRDSRRFDTRLSFCNLKSFSG